MFVTDIDGVLCETAHLAVEYARQQLGLQPHQLHDTQNDHYDNSLIERFPPEQQKEAYQLIRAAFDHNEGDIYRHAPIRAHAHQALHKLNEAGALRGYVTRRPPYPEVIAATSDWIEGHNLPDQPIEHVPRGLSKAVFMQRLNASLIVEDNPAEAQSILEHSLAVIYMDHPYNRHVEHPHLRVTCWAGVTPLVRALKRTTT